LPYKKSKNKIYLSLLPSNRVSSGDDLTIPSPNLKNDFYGCWVEARNPRNSLGFVPQPNLKRNGEGIDLTNPVYSVSISEVKLVAQASCL
jgi:hypothetical protein